VRDWKRRRAEGHDPHKPSLRSAPRNIPVGKGGIRKGGASAPPSAETKCERLQPLKYRCCLSNGVLTAGTLRRFSFRGPAHFHFRSPHNFAPALPFLAPCVALHLTVGPRHLPPSRRRPTQLVRLPSPRHAQRVRRYIFRDRRPRRDVRAVANPHRRHQRRITPDENAIADRGLMLRHAIIVAGDRSGADVRFPPDGRSRANGPTCALFATRLESNTECAPIITSSSTRVSRSTLPV